MTKPKAKTDAGDSDKSLIKVDNERRTMTRKRSENMRKSIDAENASTQVQAAGNSKLNESGVDGDIEEVSLVEEEKLLRGRPLKKGRGGKTSASTSSKKDENKQERVLQTVVPKIVSKKLEDKQTKEKEKKRTKEKNESSPMEKKEENVEEKVSDEKESEGISGCVMETVYVRPELAKFLKNNKLAVTTQVYSSAPTVQSSTSDDPPLQPLKLEDLSPQELAKLVSVPPPPPPLLSPFIPTAQVAKKSGSKRPDYFPSSSLYKDNQKTSRPFERKVSQDTQRKKLTYHQKQKKKMNRAVDARLAQMYQQPLSSQNFAPVYQAQQFAPPSVPAAQTMSAQPVLLQYPPQYPLQSYSAFPQPNYLFQSAAPPPNTQQPVLPPPYYYNNR